MSELREAMHHRGMFAWCTEFPDVNIDHFVGSMVTLDKKRGLVLNEMGRHFLRRFRDLPVIWGEVIGRREETREAHRDREG
jgi:hypothetical protein